ncbi:MAG: TolC family protein, partial [Pseudomonadales bacterium]|nr:TolC family protein [Pseudomonadales bacterium]
MLNNSVRGTKVRRTLKYMLAGALASAPLAVGTASAETLVEAIEAAITYHPRIYRDQALSVAADHAVEEAYSEFLPKLDLEASSGWEVTDSPTTRGTGRGVVDLFRNEARLSLTQLVFDFHGTANRVASAESELESSNADVQATSEEIGIETANVFLDVLGAR